MALRGRLAREVAAVGLDLLEPVGLGVPAVGPAAHHEAAMRAFDRDLAAVGAASAASHGGVAGHALHRGGRGRETQVEVAGARGELAQGAHADRVRLLVGAQDGPSCAAGRSIGVAGSAPWTISRHTATAIATSVGPMKMPSSPNASSPPTRPSSASTSGTCAGPDTKYGRTKWSTTKISTPPATSSTRAVVMASTATR